MYCSQFHECGGMPYEETWYEPEYDESEEAADEPEVYCQFFKFSIEDEPF
jgi:hypothetical protein